MTPRCWFCDAGIPTDTVEQDGILLPRETSEGGPLWILVCPGCETEVGAERNAAGAFLVVPREPPWTSTLFDRRRALLRAHARAWFRENEERRREFHAASPRPRRDPDGGEPPPAEALDEPEVEPGPGQQEREEPRPEPARAVDDLLAHYRRLDIPLTASVEEVTTAYRKLSQKCHPDKVAHLDEEFQVLADRKFRELKESYEAIVAGLSA